MGRVRIVMDSWVTFFFFERSWVMLARRIPNNNTKSTKRKREQTPNMRVRAVGIPLWVSMEEDGRVHIG